MSFTCARCGQLISNVYSNVGAWKCSQHFLDIDEKTQIYKCCKKPLTFRSSLQWNGCVSCDHCPFFRKYTVDDDFRIPISIVQLVISPIRQDAIINFKKGDTTIQVRRYDWKKAEELYFSFQ